MSLKIYAVGLGLLGTLHFELFATDYRWIGASRANWGTSSHWTPSGPPNDSGATATFDQTSGHPVDVDTNGPYSVGTLSFGATGMMTHYTLSDSGTLNVYTAITNTNTKGLQNVSCTLNLEGDVAISTPSGSSIAFQGPITGTGGLTLNSGMLYFLNSDQVTYTGTTTINSGNFEAGAANVFSPYSAFVLANSADASLTPGGSNLTIGSLAGGSASTVGLDGSILTIGNDNTTTEYDGTISDGGGNPGGGIIKIGSGALTLGGDNAYSGNTDISGGVLALNGANTFSDTATVSISFGTLTLGNSSALGASSLTMADSTTLVLTSGVSVSNGMTLTGNANITVESGAATLSGVILGSGALIQNGPGMLALSGSNSYLGATTINSGTLQVTGSASLQNSFSVTIATDATLDLSGVTSSPVINTLSGAGSIAIGNQTLTVNQGSSGTYSGVISGEGGSFVKTGPGPLTLSGNNTYTGTTTVSQGSLSVSGSSASGLSISSGAILRGTGTFGSITLENGATLAPGNSVGTITTSSVDFDPGSIFQVEINPTEASSLIVTGTATLDGNVQVMPDAGSYGKQGQYLILDAASISGAFAPTVLGELPGYTFKLNQTNDLLYLLYSIKLIPTVELSDNAFKVANYLNDYADVASITLLNNLSGNTLSKAINSVSPARNAFGTYITEQTAFSFSNLLTTHIDNSKLSREESSKKSFVANLLVDASDKISVKSSERSESKFSGWISGLGGIAHQKAQNQSPSFNFISEAVIAGLDYHIGRKGLAGAALGYAHTHFYDEGNAGHGHINYYLASAYGNAFINQFYMSPAIWGVFNQIDNTRHITFPGFSQNAKANIFAWQMIPHLEVGYEFKYSWGGFTPFTSADWAISWQRSYTEKGSSFFNASQKANNSSMARSETGLKFCEKWQKSWGTFFLKEKISYVFEKPFGVGTVNATFTGIPSSFTVSAVNHNLNLAAIGLDFLLALGEKQSWMVDFSYNGEVGSSYLSNDLTLNLSKHF